MSVDESTEHPKILANWVIKQMVEHMLADAPKLEGKDYLVIRTVFRSAGGEWSAITGGDTKALDLLKNIVTAWGAEQGPKKQSEFI